MSGCPACGAERTVPFYDGGLQPLATLARFASKEEAIAAKRLPLEYVRCVGCGHVFNAAFDPAMVPTSGTHPGWGMFNGATKWSAFMRETAERLAMPLAPGSLVVEIGHGQGDFLRMVADTRPDLECVGFDPWGAESAQPPVLRREHLPPGRVRDLGAALVIIRHVLEHVDAPWDFLRGIGAGQRVYVEVPCIDRAIETARTVDFFYEHVQQFTTQSLTGLVARTGSIESHGQGYDAEVVWAIAVTGPGRPPAMTGAGFEHEASVFEARTRAGRETVVAQLAELVGKSAIWGGAGKGAAFIARYEMDDERFPIVVDSDPSKVGTFVAGTGQAIRAPEWLLAHPADVILVPPQWRARDIQLEMRRKGIGGRIVLEHEGRLVDWERDPHPYR